ncbi:MAG TPA: oxidoreductase [Pseudomonas sp.]|nr:oxidoreductase [Pseudomonas sp.]
MGLFDKIKDKLGMGGASNEAHKPAAPDSGTNQHATDTVVDSERPTTANNATTAPPGASGSTPGMAGAAGTVGTAGSTTSAVDVPAKLDGMAATHPEKLNWRTSIVDLLKLLGLDSSLESRKELATELGCPPDQMADSAQMNMWLHRTVMHKLAEHGGTVPPELRT